MFQYRRHCLLAALMALFLLALTTGASARTHHGSVGTKTFKSLGCEGSVNSIRPTTWACAKITVPREVAPGQRIPVKFEFKAKKQLEYVEICFSEIGSAKCAKSRPSKYTVIRAKQSITRILQLTVPKAAQSRNYLINNYTRFSKPPKGMDRSAYWVISSYVHVVVAPA